MDYLLDSNTFIEAKNKYYRPTIFCEYWRWLSDSYKEFAVASIESVKDELKEGNDYLSEWAATNNFFFLPVSDIETQSNYIQIIDSIYKSGYKRAACDDFIEGADPWLIAKAMTLKATVVTHERLNLNSKRKVLIPNMCREFQVSYIDTYDLLETLEVKFSVVKRDE
ncbi:DUF4411 family protein [Fastidiosibacter lacustris]|uniref:DUF4411 family protein n=1 Tax=Fastidiosibacter lacustris TaxID=2056695 RepID=UPI000E34BD0C|nr:DUF4411 family protein [Fastidiosibacter lacustris]